MYSKRFTRLKPYTPGEQPQNRTFLKLNTNETPYPPCPEIRDLLQNFPVDELRLYPDPQSEELRKVIGEVEGVPPSRVFVSNGSDEALSFCFFTFFDKTDGPLIYPQFTYSFYPVYCRYYDLTALEVPLKNDFSLDIDNMCARVKDSCGIIFPNPNAPTGRYEELKRIELLLQAAGTSKAVIVDEAYIDFGGESAVKLISRYPNLVVVKTLSKGFSLAGARLGYTVAGEEITKALFAVKDSFNSYPIDRITQHICTAALKNFDYYNTIQQAVINTRETVTAELRKQDWDVLPSKANFIFAKKPGKGGKEIYSILRENNILVRHFEIPGIDDFVRITIGTDDEMKHFLSICQADVS